MSKSTMHITKATGIFTILLALLVLAGWIFNIPLFRTILPGIASTKFNTAICFIFSGSVLYLLGAYPVSSAAKRIIIFFSLLVLFIGCINLVQNLTGWNAGIDELLWKDRDGPLHTSSPGRMSLATSVNLMLIASVFLLLDKKKYHLLILGAFVIIFTGSLLVVLNHVFGASFLNSIPQLVNTALPTAILFIVITIGIFYSAPLRYIKFSFQKKIAGFFILTAIVLAFTFFAIYKSNEYSVNTVKWVNHTNEVLLLNAAILNQAKDIETGARGFVISGNESFLEPFNEALQVIHPTVRRLKQLTGDNRNQQVRVNSLDKLVGENIEVRKYMIELRRKKGIEAATTFFETGITKKKMDELRNVTGDIDREENRLLVKRKADNRKSIKNSTAVITIFQVLIILLLLAVFIIVYNNSRARNKAEREIKELNATLEKRVKKKTNEVVTKEKQYRFLMENMREGIQIISYDWKYLFVNNAVLEQSKSARKDLVGYTVKGKYPGVENTALFATLRRSMHERKAQTIEDEYLFPDGRKRWFELSIQPIPEGLLILSMDITARKEAEKIIMEDSEEKRKLIMNAALEAIICMDTNGLITFWNPQAEKIFGWKEEEVEQRRLADIIIPPQFHARHYKDIENYLRGDKRRSANVLLELEVVKRDGTEFPVELTVLAIKQNSGEFFCAFIRDISERKRAETMLKKLNLDLEEKATQLEASNTELERFAYVASHDLQEPLRTVTGFLQLVKKKLMENSDMAVTRHIDFAVDGAGRMKNMIQDLLKYSRVGSNQQHFTEVDCNEVLSTVRELFHQSMEDSKASLHADQLPVIRAIGPQIQQLFHNLVGNALKYRSDKPPEITVGCNEKNDLWQFYVRDNGIGIDPKFFERIFIIFQRLHTKAEYSGTGIGLAICKRIVEKHGGRIWVDSAEGKGCTFYFTIPKQMPEK